MSADDTTRLWKTHPSSQKGWYWFQGAGGAQMELYEVSLFNGEMLARRIRDQNLVPVARMEGLWSGPVRLRERLSFFRPPPLRQED